jgi:7-cyano-7-deazaguanine reductase
MNEIEKIASVHLGKAGDGSVVKPYVTPDYVDETLLVPIPRHLNRTAYNINDKELPFVGVDTWNAYEFSTMLKNGFPISGTLSIVCDAETPNIVESKSMKLYLNSYNMARLIDTLDDFYIIEDMIASHLEKALGTIASDYNVLVSFQPASYDAVYDPMRKEYITLEEYLNVEKIEFNAYNEDPSILKIVDVGADNYPSRWRSYSLRSNCRVTNQPDWGDVYIHMTGSKRPTPESLLQYIVSMRKENHFHEEIAECIYKRLHDICAPDELVVACLYTRRGGIDINPVRASSRDLLFEHTNLINGHCKKTPRQ